MNEPKPLDSLFKEKLFRIPDYQRGYAWQKPQLKAFWEDLVNLGKNRSHYTGVLTLKKIPDDSVEEKENEYWLVEDHSYSIYHIVDGQQRLTTFIIFVQAILEFFQELPENQGLSAAEIYLTDTQNLEAVRERFLFRTKPTGDKYRSYKFGYSQDNPSYEYLRHRIFGEGGAGTVQETFYTLNLDNAKRFFKEQIKAVFESEGLVQIQELYKKLTKKFLFNEHVIKEEFDVYMAFETMNNRGKNLSDLELLKNRLIYLTTLYEEHELDQADRNSLRSTINDAWKEVYHQLGRNKIAPLNDDDFLRAHWILFFKYSRRDGQDYIRFLLEEQFSPQRVRKKVQSEVELETPKELRDTEIDEEDSLPSDETEYRSLPKSELNPKEIKAYVLSLKECAVHWFDSWFPQLAHGLDGNVVLWLGRLNRIGITYFRPLVMAVLKSSYSNEEKVKILQTVERFIFISFRMDSARANYGSSEFSRLVRPFASGELPHTSLIQTLEDRMAYSFESDGVGLKADHFLNRCKKLFETREGFYSWPSLRYFLFEYECSLLEESRQQKVSWDDLVKHKADKVSIEHIFPQTPTEAWSEAFASVSEEHWKLYQGSLGNLLPLSMSINSSLQNDAFEDKKNPKIDANGSKVRNGYADGSHSEIEVARVQDWTPEEVLKRGLKLLAFLEERWKLEFSDIETKKEILGLQFQDEAIAESPNDLLSKD